MGKNKNYNYRNTPNGEEKSKFDIDSLLNPEIEDHDDSSFVNEVITVVDTEVDSVEDETKVEVDVTPVVTEVEPDVCEVSEPEQVVVNVVREPDVVAEVDASVGMFVVGTDVNSVCSYDNFDTACECANERTKTHGVVHHVYDTNGNIIFSSKKKLILLSLKKRGVKNADWYA